MSPADRTPEQWGRVAVGLPGFAWRALEGAAGRWKDRHGHWYTPRVTRTPAAWQSKPSATIDPDDSATAGCLDALLGEEAWRVRFVGATAGAWGWEVVDTPDAEPGSGRLFGPGEKGRACIAAAEAVGRWPGSGR